RLERALGVERAYGAGHVAAGLAGLPAPPPGRVRGVEPAEAWRKGARCLVAELMAAYAAIGLDAGEPVRLVAQGRRHAVALRAGAGEFALVGNREHRPP